MEEREVRERFIEKFGKAYYPENWDVDSEGSVGITFESLLEECTEAWTDEEILRSAFKSPEFFTYFVIGQLDWTYPSTIILEIIMDLTEEEDDDDDDDDGVKVDDEISLAKSVLKSAGYFVDNLWTVADIKANFAQANGDDISDEEAYAILKDTLESDQVIGETFEFLEITAKVKYNLKDKGGYD